MKQGIEIVVNGRYSSILEYLEEQVDFIFLFVST